MNPKTNNQPLQLDEDIEHHIKAWRVKRIAWIIFLLIILAVLFGTAGNGLISTKQAGSKERLYIKYEGISRFKRHTDLNIWVSPYLIQKNDSSIILSFNKNFIIEQEVKQIMPEPEHMSIGEDKIYFHFKVQLPINSEQRIKFILSPQKLGNLELSLKSNTETVNVKQFILP